MDWHPYWGVWVAVDSVAKSLGLIGRNEGREIGWEKQHAGQTYRHNLRMHLRAKLTNPFVGDPPAFRTALQSNKVYPPRLISLPTTGIAARRTNALRYAAEALGVFLKPTNQPARHE